MFGHFPTFCMKAFKAKSVFTCNRDEISSGDETRFG